uniref:ANK_REP_REGION domain-containing protein n=1 Tax=Macrostomum lignano TaxID=282301 RepID=A0A1I8FKA5_9PLAT
NNQHRCQYVHRNLRHQRLAPVWNEKRRSAAFPPAATRPAVGRESRGSASRTRHDCAPERQALIYYKAGHNRGAPPFSLRRIEMDSFELETNRPSTGKIRWQPCLLAAAARVTKTNRSGSVVLCAERDGRETRRRQRQVWNRMVDVIIKEKLDYDTIRMAKEVHLFIFEIAFGANRVKEAQPPGSAVALVAGGEIRDARGSSQLLDGLCASTFPTARRQSSPILDLSTSSLTDPGAGRERVGALLPHCLPAATPADASPIKLAARKVEDVNDSPPVPVESPISVWAPEGDIAMRPLLTRLNKYIRDADRREAAAIVSLDIDTGRLTPRIVFDGATWYAYNFARGGQRSRTAAARSSTKHQASGLRRVRRQRNKTPPVFLKPEYVFFQHQRELPARSLRRAELKLSTPTRRQGNVRQCTQPRARTSRSRIAAPAELRANLDRETQAEYSFHVLAIDQPAMESQPDGHLLSPSPAARRRQRQRARLVTSPPHYPAVFHLRQREPGVRVGRVRAEDSRQHSSRRLGRPRIRAGELGGARPCGSAWTAPPAWCWLASRCAATPVRSFSCVCAHCDTRQRRALLARRGLYRVLVETDDVAVVGVGNWRSISESDIRNHPQAQPPSHVGGGGFGSVGASETVIACLSAMLLLLGAAVVIIVCVLAQARSTNAGGHQTLLKMSWRPGAALAAASLCDGASSLDAGQFVTESYQDYPDWAEDDFDASKSNGMRLKLPGTAVYTAHRRATTDRNAGSRYYTTSPAIGSNSEYQSLDAPRLRFPWQPVGSAEAPARLLHLGGLRANPELADSGAAAGSATLPRNFRRRADHND